MLVNTSHLCQNSLFTRGNLRCFLVMAIYWVESNSVSDRNDHTSDNKIGRLRGWSPICSSRVWLQTELDGRHEIFSAYHLNAIFGDSGEHSNGTVHPSGMLSEKRDVFHLQKDFGKFPYWEFPFRKSAFLLPQVYPFTGPSLSLHQTTRCLGKLFFCCNTREAWPLKRPQKACNWW